ncbi:hypothetical protein D3C72_1942400 [compost metagenome]
MRVGASQDWPELLKHSSTLPVTRSSRSASAKTMFGDLPPSSSVTRLTVSAASLLTAMPARVEPVNDIMSISRCFDSTAPALMPSPLTRLKTPAGKPASSIISA